MLRGSNIANNAASGGSKAQTKVRPAHRTQSKPQGKPSVAAQAPAPDEAASPERLPLGRVLSSRQFWELMERWHVPDATALELIGFSGKIGAAGKRPRFRFSTRQLRATAYLAEIDRVLCTLEQEPSWLQRRIRSAPFSGQTPVAHMLKRGPDGMAEVLRALTLLAMRKALA